MRSARFTIIVGLLTLARAQAEPLPNTAAIEWEEADLSERLMDGAHAFVERKVAEALTSPASDLDSGALRERLARRLGVVDARPAPRMEFFATDTALLTGEPATSRIAETTDFQVHQVRWDVLDGIQAEGLYVNPLTLAGSSEAPPPAIVLVPDAGETPEDLLGIGARLLPEQRLGLRLAEAGFRVLIATTINREIYLGPDGQDERLQRSQQTHREWIYRQAFQMGRHVLGYEIQAVLAGAEWLRESRLSASVGVAGWGEGGRIALLATAIDPEIQHALVSGAFGPADRIWTEPIDRNVFGRLPDFSDAGIARLISPRTLLIEHGEFPAFADAKGEITKPSLTEVEAELQRIGPGGSAALLAVANGKARGDFQALAAYCQAIGFDTEVSRLPPVSLLFDERRDFDPQARHRRLFTALEDHVQQLVAESNDVRRERFFHVAEPQLDQDKWTTEVEHPTLDPANFIANAATFREEFHRDLIGRFDEPFAAPNPRTRQILDNDRWTAWDVVLDVYPEFFAWGVLLLPKDLEPGERRPVVVCQHGRNGVPLDTINAGKSAYNDFAARLCERGFIVFSPHNLYRGEDRYRWLDRKANAIGCTLFSFITDSHRQILDWLRLLPQVDPTRIAFYGLSYGGETAVRIPVVLEDYSLSICSGDFNQWTRKVAATDFPKGFMKSIEWEMPYWNLGQTYDYAEMAALIFPRPFMVERGHHDRVSQDWWVAHEYAKVRWLYAQFGLGERTAIEFFQGGHSINGEASFDFLHRHLDWPHP